MAKLRFSFNSEKFVNAVAYLAEQCPNSTKMSICKQLFYADKEHLTRFGRPIVGDHYYRLDHGPVPTKGLNILRNRASGAEQALLEKYVSIAGHSIDPKQPADKKVFSKTDLAVLDEIVQKYGNLSAAQLRHKTHSESAWINSESNCPIDYELFFEDGDTEMMALAKEEQESRDLLRPYSR